MGIPGEDLPGSHSATDFVAWYNGHPDYAELEFDLSAETAVVVGNGNVAMDVTRMLTTDPEELAKTDCADHALEVLRESKVREVVVLGRRGPAQAAFTNPELLELRDLTDADVYVDPRDCELDEHSAESLEAEGSKTARKNVEIVTGYSTPSGRAAIARSICASWSRRWRSWAPSASRESGSCGTSCTRATTAWSARSQPTSPTRSRAGSSSARSDTAACRSRGCRSTSSTASIPNEAGRIGDGGEYVVGWIKRGPSGIIGTNKRDAQETVNTLLEDVEAGRLLEPSDPDPESLEQLLTERKPDHVTYEGWEAIDRAEREAGEAQGRPRMKLTRTEELLEAAREKVG